VNAFYCLLSVLYATVFYFSISGHATALEQLEFGNAEMSSNLRTNQTEYIRIKVLSQTFEPTYNLFFTVYCYNALLTVIALTYLMFSGSEVPALVLFLVALADICSVFIASYIFSQATESHLASKKVFRLSNNRALKGDYKFWTGMRPIVVGVGGQCSFETREFLLFIWGDVVVTTIINLLIAT